MMILAAELVGAHAFLDGDLANHVEVRPVGANISTAHSLRVRLIEFVPRMTAGSKWECRHSATGDCWR
jgi:hypothetical protein